MAKVAFGKLGLKVNNEVKTININNNQIEVKQYLPISDKLELVARVLNSAADENNFSNPVKLEVYGALEIIFAYTNLSFTEKQKEDAPKLYDLLESNGVIDEIMSAIPKIEYDSVIEAINGCSDAFYTYRNSAVGILETISQDYSNLNLDASAIQKEIADPNNLSLLKDVLTKLG